MANEIAVSGYLSIYQASIMSSPIVRQFAGFLADMTGSFTVEGTVSIATAGTAIPLGQVVQPSFAFVHNLDGTNYLRLSNGVAGAKLVKLLAGDYAIFRFDDTAVPYGFADTAAVLVEYLIASL